MDKSQKHILLALFAVFLGTGCHNVFSQENSQSARNAGAQSTQTTPAQTTPAQRTQETEKLILQLGSPNYSVRQSATERLWEFGNEAKTPLQRASKAGNPEVAKRANEILSVLEMGVDFQTKPDIAKLVLDFQSNENQGRLAIIQRLIEQDKIGLAFDLLERIKDKELQQELYIESFDFKNLVDRLARSDRWDEFELVYSHPLTFEHYRSAGVLYHHLNGTLGPLVEQLKLAIEEKENSGKALDTDELTKLIAIFKFQGKFDQAQIYANKIEEFNQRFSILNLMLLEQGNWKRVAEKMVRSDEATRPEDGKIIVSPAQRALVYRFLGDEIGYDQTIDGLEEKIAELEKEKRKIEAREARDRLAEIGAVCQDWSLVEPNIDRTNKHRAFQIYISHNRTEKAFEILGVGDDVDKRSLWFSRRLRNINSLTRKVERLRETGDEDEAELELEKQWEVCFQVCDSLGSLGLTDEAVLHYQTLYEGLMESDKKSRMRIRIVYGLAQLERFDEAWFLIGKSVTRRQLREFDNYLFPYKVSSANFWLNKLRERYPDSVERLKVVSGILNSPLGTTPDFNLDLELASIRSDPTLNIRGQIDYQVSRILAFHGDDEGSKTHFRMALELGDYYAKREAALLASVDGDPQAVVNHYEKTWRDTPSRSATSFAPILAAEGLAALGETKKANLRMCLSYAQWMSSYRNTGTINSIADLEKLHLITDFLKLDVYGVEKGVVSNERNRSRLSEALVELDPTTIAHGKQMNLFNEMAGDSSGRREIEAWASLGNELNIAMAKQLMGEKKFEQAVRLLLRSNEFNPGDPSLIEGIVPELDKAGASDLADKLFEKTTEFYFEFLQKYPDSSLHRNNYAWACACANRRMQHMRRHALLAVAERPNSATFLDTLAEVHFLMGDKEQAIQACRRCIQLNPTKKHYKKQLKRFQAAE
ncbi:MAG: hypothetical protein AB8B55_17225 [Mariniblastus sp.]